MKTRIVSNKRLARGLASLLVAASLVASGASAHAQTPATLSPDLQEIVRFAQAHMSDDVIISYIKTSGKSYNISGDDILALNTAGVSQPVITTLLQTKAAGTASAPAPAPAPAPVPTPSTPPPAAPIATMPPPQAEPAPAAGFLDVFSTDAGLNPSVWTTQSPILQSVASWYGAVSIPPALGFGPAGMQMSGVSAPNLFTGVQSVNTYMAPFTVTTTVTGMEERGVPFEVMLLGADMRQFVTVTGHLGGPGTAREELGIRTPLFGARIPLGHEPSPEHGVWVNWTGSGQPVSALGNKIFPFPRQGLPYTVSITVGADGIASMTMSDAGGVVVGALNAMPVGTGPFNVILASRREGPTFANWQSVQVTPLAPPPPPPVAITAPPATPDLSYYQANLGPYGQWIDVPGVGPAWIPAESSDPFWRPYMNGGHWEYTDAGWFWNSDYPWGDIAFHYGRWMKNDWTSFRWAWVPGYDWAPSWVVWREGDGAMAWAPLPYDVEYRSGVGLWWHGGIVAADVDFGIGADFFVVVGNDHFYGDHYDRWAYDHDRARGFYDHSHFHAGYRMDHGHFVAEGLGREHVAAVTHHDFEVHRAEEIRHANETRNFTARETAHPEVRHAMETHGAPGHSGVPERGAGMPNRGATQGHGTTTPERGTTNPGRGTSTPERGNTSGQRSGPEPARGASSPERATTAPERGYTTPTTHPNAEMERAADPVNRGQNPATLNRGNTSQKPSGKSENGNGNGNNNGNKQNQ